MTTEANVIARLKNETTADPDEDAVSVYVRISLETDYPYWFPSVPQN